jgi:hypothetical protein
LDNPEDTKAIKSLQNNLRNNNYYSQEHQKNMKKEPDGKAGKFTIEAMNNMIAANQKSQTTETK